MVQRRKFLKGMGIALAGIPFASNKLQAETQHENYKPKALFSFGVLTDLHHDLIKDGPRRVEMFIAEMNRLKPDFVIQMGDFCVPKPANQVIMDAWNGFKGTKYHVIGNHDNDGGFSHDEVVSFWNAKAKYYSFDLNGYHFIVLNGNERLPGSAAKGYPNAIGDEQRDWLKHDLDSTALPVIVFCHQGIDDDMDGLKEGALIRLLFERANQKAGFQKVRLVLSGHHHEDYLNVYNNINYLQINSASYQFARLKNGYDFELTVDPLWAFVSVYTDGTIQVKGKKSAYATPREPADLREYDGYPTVPYISDRVIKTEAQR
ncbi:metallophosphoesterase [Mucilaginibacter gynuensis]|uniref:Metallophosphoesterase n=1 Tax=Mucilaginibacter gynuensis TaxID=1302236 RepID=A0ABP8H7A3_9SPHI